MGLSGGTAGPCAAYSTSQGDLLLVTNACPTDQASPSVVSSAGSATITSAPHPTKQARLRRMKRTTAASPIQTTNPTGNGTACCAVNQFTLTLTSVLPCDKPIADFCSANHAVNLTHDQWNAYQTDDFWASYVHNNTGRGGSLMYNFLQDYVGVGEGATWCTSDGTSTMGGACDLQDPCDTIRTTGPYKYQAIFVLQSMISESSRHVESSDC